MACKEAKQAILLLHVRKCRPKTLTLWEWWAYTFRNIARFIHVLMGTFSSFLVARWP